MTTENKIFVALALLLIGAAVLSKSQTDRIPGGAVAVSDVGVGLNFVSNSLNGLGDVYSQNMGSLGLLASQNGQTPGATSQGTTPLGYGQRG